VTGRTKVYVDWCATDYASARTIACRHLRPQPYNAIRYRQKPFSETGFAFGGNSGVFAESPDRILIAQRGETRLPDPLPPTCTGFAGSFGINVLHATDRRVLNKNFLYYPRR
jgi:hypothetical protein